MDVDLDLNRLVIENDECPHCHGIGKLNLPGAPDCPHCKGVGVMEPYLCSLPQNEAKSIPVR